MQTSPNGQVFLAHHEGGHVLKAYKCPADKWTISVGLTAASGVVKPHAGMTITREESERLFKKALTKYERRTEAAMPGAKQYEFDGGVSFDFNTGQVHKASWVKLFMQGLRESAEASLMTWNKGGGKVLRGLTNRRKAEADLIFRGVYNAKSAAGAVNRHGRRQPAMQLGSTGSGVKQLQEQLAALGYFKADEVDALFGESTKAAVIAFQKAHPNLTADGVAGAATMAQIQRNIDARSRAKETVATGAGGGVVTTGGNEVATPDVTGMPTEYLLIGVGVLTAVVLIYFAIRYREVIVQRLNKGRE